MVEHRVEGLEARALLDDLQLEVLDRGVVPASRLVVRRVGQEVLDGLGIPQIVRAETLRELGTHPVDAVLLLVAHPVGDSQRGYLKVTSQSFGDGKDDLSKVVA